MQRDNVNVSGFQDINDTEIPQLQAHAKKLTEQGRITNSRRFLTDLLQLINSLVMWAGNDGSRMGYTESEKRAEETHIRSALRILEKEFQDAVAQCVKDTISEFTEHIYDNFDQSIPAAIQAAVPTATAWGAPRTEGGLYWATYKATCRRNGVYSGASGPRDFNAELFEPISVRLANGWEKAFQRRLPRNLDDFVQRVNQALSSFHKNVTTRTSERLPNFGAVGMLDNQHRALAAQVTEIPQVLREEAQRVQREANRDFTPQIQQMMLHAYDVCTEERGPGSYARMKNAMISHVADVRNTMFYSATKTVRQEIDQLLDQMQSTMQIQMKELHARIQRDYLAVLVGSDISSQGATPRAERMLRAEMVPLLEKADVYFAGLEKPTDLAALSSSSEAVPASSG